MARMDAETLGSNVLKIHLFFMFSALLLETHVTEAGKLTRTIPKTLNKTHLQKNGSNFVLMQSKKVLKIPATPEKKVNTVSSFLPSTIRRRSSARSEMLKEAILTLPQLHQLLAPIKWRGSLNGIIGPSDYGHLRGTVRLKRLYCRVGIGYHLEINEKGKVTATHLPTSNGILEIFSVKRQVVGIRSVAHRNRYLCVNRSGKLLTRRRFQPSCEFRENLEGNRFNTYASEKYSHHKKRKGYFLAINRNGKIPRKLKKVSWKQKRAQWLPRSV